MIEARVAEEIDRIERTGEFDNIMEKIKDIEANSEFADCKPGDYYLELCEILGKDTIKAISVLKSRLTTGGGRSKGL